MFATPLYFPFKTKTPIILYNESQTILPSGDGYHIEIFRIADNNFQSIVDRNGDKKWLKGPLKSEQMINAYKFLLSFSGDDKFIEIEKEDLDEKDGVYFYFEYIEPNGDYFEKSAVWVYDANEMKLYYLEGSV